MSTIAEVEEKLRILKKLKVDVRVRNKKEVLKQEAGSRKRVYTLDEAIPDAKSSHEENDVMKLMSYSMRDYEQWDKLTKKRASNESITGDFQNLAKNTYNKEIKNIGEVTSKNLEGKLSGTGQIILTDDAEKVERLAETLKNNASSRYKVRKTKLEKDINGPDSKAHINQKNQRFNAKLAKQFK